MPPELSHSQLKFLTDAGSEFDGSHCTVDWSHWHRPGSTWQQVAAGLLRQHLQQQPGNLLLQAVLPSALETMSTDTPAATMSATSCAPGGLVPLQYWSINVQQRTVDSALAFTGAQIP